MGMKRSVLGLASLLLLACDPATKDGGDINGTESDGGSGPSSMTDGPDSQTATGNSGSDSNTTASSTDSSASSGTDTVAETDTAGETDSVGGTVGDTDGEGVCVDFVPAGRGCGGEGEATAAVGSVAVPGALVDQVCASVLVENVDASTDRVVMDCEGFESAIEFTVTSENPHLDLPLNTTDVILNTDENFGNVGGITIVIRSADGDILFASVDGTDDSGSPWNSPLLSPLEVTMGASGCPGYGVDEKCPAGQQITAQRAALEISVGGAASTLYSGNQAVLSGDADYSVIVAGAQRIVCWDDGCTGDDSGPFDEVQLVLVRLPEA